MGKQMGKQLNRVVVILGVVASLLLLPSLSAAQVEPDAGFLLAGGGFVPRPDAGWGAVATIEIGVPLHSYPLSLWFGALGGYQDGPSVTADLDGFTAIGGFYAGVAARTRGMVYLHGGVGLLVAGIWSNSFNEIQGAPGTYTENMDSDAGIGGIGVLGVGLDIRSFILRLDGMFLGAAAGEGNSFAGYGGRVMLGARLL